MALFPWILILQPYKTQAVSDPHPYVFHWGSSVCMVCLMVNSRAPRVMHVVYYKMPTYAADFNWAQPYQLIYYILYTYKWLYFFSEGATYLRSQNSEILIAYIIMHAFKFQ